MVFSTTASSVFLPLSAQSSSLLLKWLFRALRPTSHGNGLTFLLEKIVDKDHDRDKLNHPTADITAHPRFGIRRMKRGKLFTDFAPNVRVRAAILLLSAGHLRRGFYRPTTTEHLRMIIAECALQRNTEKTSGKMHMATFLAGGDKSTSKPIANGAAHAAEWE